MVVRDPRTGRQERVTCEKCGASFFRATFERAGACEHLQARFAEQARKGEASQ